MKPLRLKHNLMATLLALFVTATSLAQDVSRASARPAPKWLREGVVYEVFPRNFSTQGTFNAITVKLDELKDLGVNVLWLMPIHPIGEKLKKGTIGSPYAVKDFYAVNPDYGTLEDLRRLVAEAHKRDMKIIIDIVANHTAWDSVMMKNPDFYKKDASGKIVPPVEDWKDVAGLNYDNPAVRRYMIDMLKYWVGPEGANLDGFRCDVAHMMPISFWEEARVELAKVKPDFMLLAEASKPELLVKAFDIDYAWPFHGTLNNVLLHNAPATEFRKSWEETLQQFPRGSLHLRISDNHDEARAVARFSIKGALATSVLMLTLDGVPLLYNGMEVGDATESGAPALFEKLPIFWEPKERPPLREIYKDLIRIRKQYAPFTNDRVIWLRNSDEANLVSFMRLDSKDEFVVLINFSNRPIVGWVEVMNEKEFKPMKIAGTDEVPAGFPLFRLGGFEWRIYHRQTGR